MNLEKWNQFQRVVLKLIKSGDPELSGVDIKEIKTLCKTGLVAIPDVFDLLLKHLQTNHSQIRISTFQILDQLFHRCHAIRELTLEKLKTIVSLTLALELSEELPPPAKFHEQLKKVVIKSLDTWNDKFGQHYNKLKVSCNFLKNKKNVDFKKFIAQTHFEQQQEEKRQKQERDIRNYVVMKTLAEFEEKVESFEDCIFEVSSCFDLLMPNANKGDRTNSNDTNVDKSVVKCTENENKLVLPIKDFDPISMKILETPDSISIIQSLDDRIHQAKNAYIPRLDKWIEELIRNNGEQKDILPLIKAKEKLVAICNSYDGLEITRTSKRKRRIVQKDQNESDDSEFDEVDDDDVLKKIPEQNKLQISMVLEKSGSLELLPKNTSQNYVVDEELPCSSGSLSSNTEKDDLKSHEPSSDCKVGMMSDLLSKDEIDEEESDMALQKYSLVKFESQHRFWSGKDCEPEEMDINVVRALNPKYSTVPGKFEPVLWACRAVMKSEKLCPRMDRFKCPLHGKVIPRDKNGKPNGKNLFPKSENLPLKNGTWEEVEQEIEKQTGEKLNYSRIKKKKEAKRSNLVSIAKDVPKTPRSRIEKKILSKKAMRSTNEKATKMDNKRTNSAFDQQFNYAL